MTASLVFWLASALIAYTLIAYPLAVVLWARLRPRPVRLGAELPSVTIVVVAHDEAGRIRKRIDNLLALDYPPEQLNILVCSDGSTDATVALARARAGEDSRVAVLAFEHRRGKPAVLTDAVPQASGEVVVFADARQSFARDALRALVAPFADEHVGAVSGELCLLHDPAASAVGAGVGFYWRYEKLMRRAESTIDSSVGATGAIYAIRRSLFEPLPESTILDDVLIPMRAVRAGFRTWFEPSARAFDYAADVAADEYARKVRTIAGTFQLFATQPWLLDPRRNRIWFQTVSHKLLRLVGPVALAAAFLANLFLLEMPIYRVIFALQFALYTAALVEHTRARGARRGRVARWLFGIPYAFCVLQAATVTGFWRWVAGRQTVTWKKARA